MSVLAGKVVFVSGEGGDWEGMYVNGRLRREGHSLDAQHACEALGLDYTSIEVRDDDLELCGLPMSLDELTLRQLNRSEFEYRVEKHEVRV